MVVAYSPLAADLRALVAAQHTTEVPAHQRIDPGRATVVRAVRGGDFSLRVAIKRGQHDDAVRKSVNLVHRLFLLLQADYPDHLVERFGFPAE